MDDFKLAWRNVWRNTRRSVVTIAATAFALFVMIVYSGLITGYLNGLERNIIDLELGDVQVFEKGYREKPSLYTAIANDGSFSKKLESAGFRAAPRLLGTGLGASSDNSVGIRIIGIDVNADRDVSSISEKVAKGRWLTVDDEGVVLGHRLARTLGLEVGGELVVLSQGADGSMANDVYVVRGVLGSLGDEVDRAGVFMTHARFRDLMVFPAGIHQFIVRVPEGMTLEAGTATTQRLTPHGAEAASWKQIRPTLASMLESASVSMGIMFGIIYIAVGIIILNATLMAVFERIRELGVLKAIGFGPFKVFKLICLESGIQTLVAAVVGIALAIPVNGYLVEHGLDLTAFGNISVMGVAWDPVWRSEITRDTYVIPTLALLAIVTLSVIYPAIRAALIRPLEAIREA